MLEINITKMIILKATNTFKIIMVIQAINLTSLNFLEI